MVFAGYVDDMQTFLQANEGLCVLSCLSSCYAILYVVLFVSILSSCYALTFITRHRDHVPRYRRFPYTFDFTDYSAAHLAHISWCRSIP